MGPNIGEYIVGAYLKMVENCDYVDYNVKEPGGGIKGLNELDVLGLDFLNKKAYLCEVTTHIRGILYVDNKTTVKKIRDKYRKQQQYALRYLVPLFNRNNIQYMFWSPYVPIGYITKKLRKIRGLQLIINKEYTLRINALRFIAKEKTEQTGNPAFRLLQILEHLR